MYFRNVRKTGHYRIHHESEVPWSEVLEALHNCKVKRKVKGKIRIIYGSCYILCELEGDTVYVINAKRLR
jgi:hypothetical protein